MKRESPRTIRSTRMSRRRMMQLAGGGAAAGLFAQPHRDSALAQTPVPESITIPESGASLPTEPVTFRMADAGLDTRVFYSRFFPLYQEAHPNITVQYDNFADNDLRDTVAAGLQNGNAPDVFRLPINLPLAQLVQEGQLAALDDVIPNFEAWRSAFPPGSFYEGINVFGGKTYCWPHLSPRYFGSMMLYNTAYMESAGYDPVASPLTWDTFRDAARKITAAGAGQYYGFILAGGVAGRWATFVNNLARMIAPAGPDSFDWRTGERVYTSDAFLAAIDLLLALNADGSIFPGSASLGQQEAVGLMPTGVAGMFLSEASNVGVWRSQFPDFGFGVASQPQPNSGTVYPLTGGATGGLFWVVYANAQQPAVAGDLMSFVGSELGQRAWQQLSDGGPPLSFPAVNEIPDLNPQSAAAYALYDELVRVGPDPAVRNPDVALVRLQSRVVTPNLGETIQGLFTGQLDDPRQAMQDLSDREEQELERAINAAQDNGAQVSRDDWIFPNWDPTRDYTEADYQAL